MPIPAVDTGTDQRSGFAACAGTRSTPPEPDGHPDLHREVAQRLGARGATSVLDIGCGDGALARAIGPSAFTVGLDRTVVGPGHAASTSLRADAAALPLADRSMGAVVALWLLYLLDDPAAAMAEARRVLQPGGWFTASTTRRDDSPELLALLGVDVEPSTFDAEEAPALVADVFGPVEARHWDAPGLRLGDRPAVARHLRHRGIGADVATEAADAASVPLTVTRRGVLVWARR